MINISRNLKENVHNGRNIIDKNLNRTFKAEKYNNCHEIFTG